MSDESIQVVTVGMVGPQGPPNTGASSIIRSAGATVSGHRAVMVDSNGDFVHADNTDPVLAEVIGISINSGLIGEPVEAVFAGEITHLGWSWTPQQHVYLGLNGALTQTPPVAGFFTIVGIATEPTVLQVSIEPAVALA